MKKEQIFKGIFNMMPVILLVLGISVSSCSTSPNNYSTPKENPHPVSNTVPSDDSPPLPPINKAEEGIHIGIIKFAEKSEDITNGIPVLLDRNGRTSLTSNIDTKINPTQKPGTSLFHAVHLAMANLKKNESCLPENLESVYIITFTDGLDNQSAGLSRLSSNRIEGKVFSDIIGDNDSITGYSDFVKGELGNRKIAGVPILAHSVGIRGNDVPTNGSFERHLESIASPGNSKVLDNFNDLQASFSNIADSLNLHFTQTNLILTTPLLVNTRVRVTFDANTRNSADVWASRKYVEGTITSPSEGTYTLIDIAYSDGISSCHNEGPIYGTIDDVNVQFAINDICGYDPYTDKTSTRLWRMCEGYWQPDSEYGSEGSILTTNERRSAVIYLVLDCSSSLSPKQNEDIKKAVNDFVNNLYARYYGI